MPKAQELFYYQQQNGPCPFMYVVIVIVVMIILNHDYFPAVCYDCVYIGYSWFISRFFFFFFFVLACDPQWYFSCRLTVNSTIFCSISSTHPLESYLLFCSKELANFHRPKALWYPHDNVVAVKEQGKLPTQGPMKLIVKSLGGKGSKIQVNVEETISSVKAKASKKLGCHFSFGVVMHSIYLVH